MSPTFPRSLTIDACEAFVSDICNDANVADLVLPAESNAAAFGGLASAVQAVITWARRSSNRNLLVKGPSDDLPKLVRRTIRGPHKFCAAMMARSVCDAESGTNLRPIMNVMAEQAVEDQSISPYGQQRGGLCWFVFVDHSTKGFDRNFYIAEDEEKAEVRQLPQITSVIRSMVEKSMQVVGGGRKLADEDISNVGRLFWELFLNTHEHGSRDRSRSDWMVPGVRALFTNAINLSPQAGEISLRGAPPVDLFLKSLAIGSGERRRFVEISIVDSGLGFAGRWTSDNEGFVELENMSMNHEYDIFKKCFTFRETSSHISTKGNGLPVVMDRLTRLRGFMKVRSGRLSLYRDFVSAPYKEGEVCSFMDWSNRVAGEVGLTKMSPVSGVLVTLLIPLEAK